MVGPGKHLRACSFLHDIGKMTFSFTWYLQQFVNKVGSCVAARMITVMYVSLSAFANQCEPVYLSSLHFAVQNLCFDPKQMGSCLDSPRGEGRLAEPWGLQRSLFGCDTLTEMKKETADAQGRC